MKTLTRYMVVVVAVLGLVMIGTGAWFITKGFDAKADIEAALLREEVMTGQDASIPGVLVKDAATAQAQQDAIEAHTFGKWGPYSGLDREDPNRDVYLKGLTLRNSLNMAIMGFGVADLAIGTGALAILLGLGMTGLAIPVLYVMRRPEQTANEEFDVGAAPGALRPALKGSTPGS